MRTTLVPRQKPFASSAILTSSLRVEGGERGGGEMAAITVRRCYSERHDSTSVIDIFAAPRGASLTVSSRRLSRDPIVLFGVFTHHRYYSGLT